MTNPAKVMYLAPLPDGRSHADFRARWRGHGALAMGLSLWEHHTRYKQCDTIVAGEHGVSEDVIARMHNGQYGGVGMIWLDLDPVMGLVDDVETMAVDEVDTFGRRLGANLVPTEEHVIVDGEPGPITLVAALHRVDGVDRAGFKAGWLAVGAEFLARPALTGNVCRYVQNHAFPDAEYCDGFVEMSFASVEQMGAFMGELKGSGLLDMEREFLDHRRNEAVLTHENLLFERASA
ncbi:unannotated protein [freshwater metagenome]|uniref:Unannotated protein n=1 Tax=freshwater metagenome TaxID=449393 RepID=A0A6J7JCS1_9ZZZZ|nr:hypothetical protein [Actinomycetota bacterium]